MRELGRECGAELMIASPLSFACLHRQAAELAQSGLIGDPLHFSARFCARDRRLRLGRLARAGVELARRLTGSPPRELIGVTASDAPRVLSIALRLADDRIATWVCGEGDEAGISYELVGSDGSLRVSAPAENAAGILTLSSQDGVEARCLPSRVQLEGALEQASAAILAGRERGAAAQEALAAERIQRAIARELRQPSSVRLKNLLRAAAS